MYSEFLIYTIFFYIQVHWSNHYRNLLLLAYQSFGVVYGDLSTSPLYVFRSAFSGNLRHYEEEDAIFGVFSLTFWTFTLVPLLKYVFIVLSAADNGEGSCFLFALLLSFISKFSVIIMLVQEEHLLYTPSSVDMQSLACFLISKLQMRNSPHITNPAPLESRFILLLEDFLRSISCWGLCYWLLFYLVLAWW